MSEKIQDKPLYAFDAEEFTIPINVRPGSKTPYWVKHVFRRATIEELKKRDEESPYETIEVGHGESKPVSNDDIANKNLWESIATHIIGYTDFVSEVEEGKKASETKVVLTDEIRAKVPIKHKNTAIAGLWASTVEIDYGGDDSGFSILTSDEIKLVQKIGFDEDDPDFIVNYYMKEPSEADRLMHKEKAIEVRLSSVGRRSKTKYKVNLQPVVELFDKLFIRLEGGMIGENEAFSDDKKREFLKWIDPMFKRQVVDKLISAQDASLSD